MMGGPPPSGVCASFPKLRDEAKAKAELVSAIGKRKGDRKDMCAAVQNFTAAEDKVVKFLEDNKVACGVPAQAVTQAKAELVSVIGKKHGDRKDMCAAVQTFTAAEDKVVKFLEDNKVACGVPPQAVAQAKTMHANTVKFRDTVCAEGPKPKVPTLSDAIGAPPAETGTNTKTGRGTLDTLTGNPLAK